MGSSVVTYIYMVQTLCYSPFFQCFWSFLLFLSMASLPFVCSLLDLGAYSAQLLVDRSNLTAIWQSPQIFWLLSLKKTKMKHCTNFTQAMVCNGGKVGTISRAPMGPWSSMITGSSDRGGIQPRAALEPEDSWTTAGTRTQHSASFLSAVSLRFLIWNENKDAYLI
jgi:hypothetical protein